MKEKQELIRKLVDEKLIYGLGVSLVNPTEHFLSLIKQYPNAVIHVINGILSEADVKKLENNNLKMLILGYKHLRRGNDYFAADQTEIENKQHWLYENLEDIADKFKVVSFDNLAIEQLQVKRLLTDEEWNEFIWAMIPNLRIISIWWKENLQRIRLPRWIRDMIC